jgi:hypothetical protein
MMGIGYELGWGKKSDIVVAAVIDAVIFNNNSNSTSTTFIQTNSMKNTTKFQIVIIRFEIQNCSKTSATLKIIFKTNKISIPHQKNTR